MGLVTLQSTDKISEYECSSDPSNAGMDTPKPTPKIETSLKETLSMFRKCGKKPTAPSAAACIEEHRLNIKHMEVEQKLRFGKTGWTMRSYFKAWCYIIIF
ncbi:hypothetical protein TNCT_392201 [Trichonephila clavata]|uniref:Uncharacterized protein n=1 Tax=Trichonephila clavata TaxID=2740835 RepID=A0A8X6FBM6_TRICU|nr:hypothetical protein TNCT_392201 [Trichonephila clavata]